MSYGMLYVAATLLPLASFVILFLGGRRWGKIGAYIATAAIFGAFLLSLTGLITYLSLAETHRHETHAAAGHGHDAHAKDEHAAKDEHEHGHKEVVSATSSEAPPWHGAVNWAVLHFKSDGAITLKLGYYIDGLAAAMFAMVTFIATLIHLFSMGYMSDELQDQVEDHQAHVTRKGRFSRFFMFLSLFCFSMLNLVLAENLFQIFVSWELVGICSYLLVGFYYERHSASTAAIKAFVTNRVGDAGFIIGLVILWTYVGTLSFQSVKGADGQIEQIGLFDVLRAPAVDTHGDAMPHAGQFLRADPYVSKSGTKLLQLNQETGSQVVLYDMAAREHFHAPDNEAKLRAYVPPTGQEEHGTGHKTIPYSLLVLAGAGIFLGCVGKSAQFPLQVWLPDAMEGPTPVSALIHAATMVAAGVYLVGRAFPLFAPETLLIIAYTGGITLFVAATIAIVQTDIKKVLAYSTVSQLGFMMLAMGVGGWVAGLFHLITHAFFKALLFLGSGSVIYGCHHEQEMTKMGGLYPKMKITALTMLVGVLAISGTPLFSGWYSKDAIMVSALSFVSLNPQHFLLFLLPLLTAGITAFYMFRLWFMTFTGKPRDHHVYEHAHESPWIMTVPLILLAVMSVVVAWGLPPWDVQASGLEHFLHHSQPETLTVDEGLSLSTVVRQAAGTADQGNFFVVDSLFYNLYRQTNLGPHDLAGLMALVVAAIGVGVGFSVYYFGYLSPAQTKEQFATIGSFLWNKWYFDQFYSVALVRPAVIVAGWCRWFDTRVIDGFVNWLAHLSVNVSKFDGKFDNAIVDGLVNLTAQVIFGVGTWLRVFQTGLIRNYVLYLAVAAAGIFVVVSYVVSFAG